MLGRLFKLKSLLSLGGSTTSKVAGELSDGTADSTLATKSPNEANANAVSFEDSYTREILYGSLELALHPLLFNPERFRLLISQDGGDLRAKQVLYDSSKCPVESLSSRTKSPPATVAPSAESFNDPASLRLALSSNSRLPNSANTLRTGTSYNKVPIAKQTHNINDLNDYMFGRGIPSMERHTSTKIHVLLPLSLLGDGSGVTVLLSRIFLISSSGFGADSDLTGDLDWMPQPTFISKNSVLQIQVPTGKHHCASSDLSQSQNRAVSFSSRFAVGVVIPLEDPGETMEEVISSNWETIAHYLIVLQKLICKKLTLALKASLINGLSSFISNKRIVFPLGVLQLESEFGHQLQKLIKLIHYNVNTPRLININAFMTHGLNHMSTNLNSNVINWALEVINWLEFKDGRNFSAFHTQGLAIPQMHSQHSYLLQSASGASPWYRSHEAPASSNTFLASLFALIIPMRHLLAKGPLCVDAENRDGSRTITRIVVMTSNSSVAKKLLFILSGLIPDVEFLHRLENSVNINAESTGSSGTLSDTSKSGCETESNSKMLPQAFLQSEIANSPKENGISFTAKSTTSQPIPIRNSRVGSNSQSDESALASVSSTKGWDVPHKSATSLSLQGQTTTCEVANVTAAQQIPGPRIVSASNSSSMAHLSSSLNSSLSSNASNYSLSRLGSSFMDKWRNSLVGSNKFHQTFISETIDDAFTSENLNTRPTMYSASSPADELDEPVWEGSFLASAGSSMKNKCSRTQSLLNLSGEVTDKTAGVSSSALGVDRTRSSVIFPPLNDKSLNVDDVNSSIIKQKVWSLMRCDLKLSTRNEKEPKADHLNVSYGSEKSNTVDQTGTLYVQLKRLMSPQLHKKAYLQPNVAFVDEFRPEYTIQSCPVNPRLEAQVSNSMKNDLLFYQNNCGYEKVTSTTVYIGLRAREIKLIEMSVESPKRGKGHASVSPAAAMDLRQSYFSSAPSESPNSPYLNGGDHSNHEKRELPAANTFRTTVKKVFSPNKNSGDRDAINQVEAQLEKLNEVASLINSNSAETVETKDLYNRMLFNAVRELIT